jgi:hypothetical protein
MGLTRKENIRNDSSDHINTRVHTLRRDTTPTKNVTGDEDDDSRQGNDQRTRMTNVANAMVEQATIAF